MRLAAGTASDSDKVLATCLVHLDVAADNVVFVPLECHVSVLLADESNECFAVTPAHLTQAQRYATSVDGRIDCEMSCYVFEKKMETSKTF